MDVEIKTYHATLHSPLFYSSSEGVLVSADRILGSTALTYALAYTLGLIEKRYFLYGDEAVNHQYQELADIGLFVSDGKPIDVSFKEETLKNEKVRAEYELLRPEFELMMEFIKARKAAKLSQAALAKKLKLQQSAVAR